MDNDYTVGKSGKNYIIRASGNGGAYAFTVTPQGRVTCTRGPVTHSDKLMCAIVLHANGHTALSLLVRKKAN